MLLLKPAGLFPAITSTAPLLLATPERYRGELSPGAREGRCGFGPEAWDGDILPCESLTFVLFAMAVESARGVAAALLLLASSLLACLLAPFRTRCGRRPLGDG